MAATTLLCPDVQMLLCGWQELLSPPDGHTSHKAGAGTRNSGSGRQKFSTHSLSTASGLRPSVDQGRHLCPKIWSTWRWSCRQPTEREPEVREATFLRASSPACSKADRRSRCGRRVPGQSERRQASPGHVLPGSRG